MLQGKVNESGTRYAVDNPGYCLCQLYTLSAAHEIQATFEFITELTRLHFRGNKCTKRPFLLSLRTSF